MTTNDPRFNRWLPLIVLFTGWVFLIAARGSGGQGVSATGELYTTAFGLFFVVLASVSIYLACDGGRCIGVTKRITPPVIGQWIGNLLFIQSAFILFTGHIFLGLALLLFWPLNRWVRKRIARQLTHRLRVATSNPLRRDNGRYRFPAPPSPSCIEYRYCIKYDQ